MRDTSFSFFTVKLISSVVGALVLQVEPHEREVAGFVLSFCLQLGIFVGSQIALGVGKIK